MNPEDRQIMQVPPFIRVKDAKLYFGISERAAWNMLARREIKGSKKGKLWIISSASILKFIRKYESIKETINVNNSKG